MQKNDWRRLSSVPLKHVFKPVKSFESRFSRPQTGWNFYWVKLLLQHDPNSITYNPFHFLMVLQFLGWGIPNKKIRLSSISICCIVGVSSQQSIVCVKLLEHMHCISALYSAPRLAADKYVVMLYVMAKYWSTPYPLTVLSFCIKSIFIHWQCWQDVFNMSRWSIDHPSHQQ